MARRKVYIDKKELSSKEIAGGMNFNSLLKAYKIIHIPFYAKAPFILSSIGAAAVITTATLFFTGTIGSGSDKKIIAKEQVITSKEDSISSIAPEKQEETTATTDKSELLTNATSSKKEDSTSPAFEKSTTPSTANNSTSEIKKKEEVNATNADNKNARTSAILVSRTNTAKIKDKPTLEEIAHSSEKTSTLVKSKTQILPLTKKQKKENTEPKLNANVQKEEPAYNNNSGVPSTINFKESKETKAKIDVKKKSEQAATDENKVAEENKNSLPKKLGEASSANSMLPGAIKKDEILKPDSIAPKSDYDEISTPPALPDSLPDTIAEVKGAQNAADSAQPKVPPPIANSDKTKDTSSVIKAFHSGIRVVQGGFDLGIYGIATKNKVTGESKTGGAASIIYSVAGEYGIKNWLGAGVRLSLDNYGTSHDSSGNNPSAVAGNISVFANFHPVKSRRFDLFSGVAIGYSRFNYKLGDNENSVAKGNGSLLNLYIIPRFYFGKHIGMYLNFGYTGFSYGSLDYSSNTNSKNNAFSLTGSGLNFGFGVQAKF